MRRTKFILPISLNTNGFTTLARSEYDLWASNGQGKFRLITTTAILLLASSKLRSRERQDSCIKLHRVQYRILVLNIMANTASLYLFNPHPVLAHNERLQHPPLALP